MTTGRTDGGLAREVQRFGLLSAATVVGRYNDMVERAIADDAIEPDPGQLDGLDPAALVDGAARLTQAYLRFVETTAALFATRRTGSQPATERVVLPSTEAGGRAGRSLWAHNPTGVAATGIEVEVTGLVSPNGEAIPAGAVTVTPVHIDRLEATTSRELEVAVEVPAGQSAGWYFGLVRIGDDPSHPVILQLEVTGS
jgi:hypothetical protein